MKRVLLLVLLGIVLVSVHTASSIAVKSRRDEAGPGRVNVSASYLPPLMLKILAGEFKGVVADYALLEAASIVGKNEKITDEEWNAIAHLFKQTMALDPYFMQSYSLIQGTLPWQTDKYDLAVSLLNQSKDHRFWDWVPGYFIGFDYFYFIKDNATASKYLMEASQVEGAPAPLATFAARLAQRAGRSEMAVIFLKAFYEKETDEEKKEMIKERIIAHTGVYTLEKGISHYKQKFGKYPADLDELIETGLVEKIPENPYGYPFGYDPETGVVTF